MWLIINLCVRIRFMLVLVGIDVRLVLYAVMFSGVLNVIFSLIFIIEYVGLIIWGWDWSVEGWDACVMYCRGFIINAGISCKIVCSILI